MQITQISSDTTIAPLTVPRGQAAKNDEVEQEKITLGNQSAEALTYSKPRAIPDNLAAMLQESDQKVEDFMNLLRPLLEQQGLTAAKVIKGEQRLTVDQGTIDAAKSAISEDGEWGVKKVSERILSFAKFAIGDDPAQLQKIRDAVEQGFAQAKETLGGALPDISQKTHDTIMAELDRWAKEGIPAGETVSLANTGASADQASSKT